MPAVAVLLLAGTHFGHAQPNVVQWGAFSGYPAYATNVVAMDGSGFYQAAGLRRDGTVFRWANSPYGDDAAVIGFTNVVAVIANPDLLSDALFAVRSNGSVAINYDDWEDLWFNPSNDILWPSYAFGSSYYGARGLAANGSVRAGDYFYRYPGPQRETTRLSNVVDVVGYSGPSPWPEVASFSSQVALKPDGSLAYPVQTTSGLITYSEIPILSASNIVALASEDNHVLALREDGTVLSWGFNCSGTTNVPAGLSNVIAIAASHITSMALKSDGTVVVWGDNSRGQTNVPAGLTNVMAIAANELTSFALLAQGPPFLTAPLPDRVGLVGGKVYFRMQASGEWPLSYQWRHYGTNLPGQTNMVLKLTSLDASHAGLYSCVVSNTLGTATTREAQLSLAPFFLHRDPQSLQIALGTSTNLSVQVQSQLPMAYQWQFNGADIPGATNITLPLDNVTFDMSGQYRVVLTNSFGTVTSGLATISGRQLVGWGDSYCGDMFHGTTTNAVSLALGDGQQVSTLVVTEGGELKVGSLDPILIPPAGLTNVLSAVTGQTTPEAAGVPTALLMDGTTVEWGNPSYRATRAMPAGLSNVVAVFTGEWNNRFAVQADGNLVAWNPARVTNTANLISIADPLAVRGDGTVVTLDPDSYPESEIPPDLTNLVAVSYYPGHSLGLRRDGTDTAWGPDGFGGTRLPAGLSNVVAIVAGAYASYAVLRDGTLVRWGAVSSSSDVPPPMKDLVHLASTWQAYNIGVIGYGPPKVLTHVGRFSGVVGGQTLFQCKAAGKPPLHYQWRKDGVNVPGATNAMLVLRNTTTADNGVYSVEVRNALGTNVAGAAQLTVQAATFPQPAIPQQTFRGGSLILSPQVYGSGVHSYQWLFNGSVIAGATNATLQLSDFGPTQAGQYSLRVSNEFGVAESPPTSVSQVNVAAWGDYSLASGNSAAMFTPAGLNDAVQLAAGVTHALALRRDGTVLAWGENEFGQTTVPSSLSNAVAIAAGSEHSLALLANQTVVGWGRNYEGQTNIPPGLSNVIALSASYHNLALRSDGTVVAWGWNDSGQTNVPPGLSNVTAIAAGGGHSVALRGNRTVVAWGDNYEGQTNIPPGLSNVIAIAAGGSHNLALRSDGTVVAWGNNTYGQTNVPPGLSNVIAVAAGAWHSLALRADHTVVGWGANYGGQQTNPPVGLSNAVAIAAGGGMSLALVGVPPSDPPQLDLQLAAGRPEVLVSGPPGQIVTIQSTSNLVNWATVAQQTNYTGHWLWQDAPIADRESGFYRSLAGGQTPTPFVLSGATVSPDGTIRFTVHGPPGWNFRVEASSNSLDWEPVAGLKSIGETPISLMRNELAGAQLLRVSSP